MKKSILARIFKEGIKSKNDVINELREAVYNNVIDNDSLSMIEAVINISELKVRDIMIPRNQIDVLDVDDSIDTIVSKILNTGHSRFPVIDKEISSLLGIFHSKDLVSCMIHKDKFSIKDHLREAYFVPEIKRLDNLMYEMRLNHVHLAIVVDEFTNIAGIVTLEMIIEQIIGEIEDEYDEVEGEKLIVDLGGNKFRVKGFCKLNELESKLGISVNDDLVETIGGFLVKTLGRIPKLAEVIKFKQYNVEIVNVDSRKINLIIVAKL